MDEPRGDLFNGARPFIMPPVFFDDPPPSGGKGPYKIKHVGMFNLICICDKRNVLKFMFSKKATKIDKIFTDDLTFTKAKFVYVSVF